MEAPGRAVGTFHFVTKPGTQGLAALRIASIIIIAGENEKTAKTGCAPFRADRRSHGRRKRSLPCRLLLKDACGTPDRHEACNAIGQGFSSANDENPAWDEFLHNPLKGLPLKAFIKIGKDEVPAQYEVEGPFRQLQADILS